MKIVHGVGSRPCDFLLCGEGPGFEEDRTGVPFSGKTGRELERFLDGNKLPNREDVFLTNVYRQFGGKKYFYTSEDLVRDQPYLIQELEEVNPQIIIPLGRYATRWFLGDVDMDETQGLPWLLYHAQTPTYMPRLRENAVVFPVIHVAAGFHNPEMSPYVVAGFNALAAYLEGVGEARRLYDDPYPQPQYEEITDGIRLAAVLGTQRSGELSESALNLALDTEGSPRAPWSVQFSFEPGSGYLIRAQRRDLLVAFGNYLTQVRPRVTYHSALHDLVMLRVLGLPTDMPFDDSMVQSYLLQLEPQGLKALATRHCNMKMQSYDEVLGDASQRLALDYIVGLWDCEQLDWEERCEDAFWTEIDKGRKIRKFPAVPKSPLHKACERAMRSKDARKLWSNQVEDVQVAGYTRLGPMPDATLSHVPSGTAVHYGCRDTDATTRVRDTLGPRVDALGLRGVYDLELGTYPLIERMTRVGLKPHLPHFARLSERLAGELVAIRERLVGITGNADFNANSGDQCADLLFDGLGLSGFKKTDSGRFSTNDKTLEALENEHPDLPVIGTIREYREVFKLKNTFVDRLPDFVRRWPYDGRIHATFRTTRVITGRLAASDPNLLAMPKHGEFAKDFRQGWIPEDGHILCEWDLSQIELRVLAHLSQDPVLLGAYRDGLDLHAKLAQRIFGGKESDYKKGKERLAAKAINFGIPMGMTYKGLMVELRKNGVMVNEDETQQWLNETMALYKKVGEYQDRMAAEAKRHGYVRCLSGRIRYIGGIRSKIEQIAAEARRFAFSTPIQEGAQFLVKAAERRLYEDILVPYWKQGRWVEPLIQIHDALTLECEDDMDLARDLHEKMVKTLTMIPDGFSVPVETSGDYGWNWADKSDSNERGMRSF